MWLLLVLSHIYIYRWPRMVFPCAPILFLWKWIYARLMAGNKWLYDYIASVLYCWSVYMHKYTLVNALVSNAHTHTQTVKIPLITAILPKIELFPFKCHRNNIYKRHEKKKNEHGHKIEKPTACLVRHVNISPKHTNAHTRINTKLNNKVTLPVNY